MLYQSGHLGAVCTVSPCLSLRVGLVVVRRWKSYLCFLTHRSEAGHGVTMTVTLELVFATFSTPGCNTGAAVLND